MDGGEAKEELKNRGGQRSVGKEKKKRRENVGGARVERKEQGGDKSRVKLLKYPSLSLSFCPKLNHIRYR